MKKLFTLLTLVILGITTFTACSKDDENTGTIGEEEEFVGDGSITLVADSSWNLIVGLDIYTFNEGDAVTIDWGDGKVETLKSVKFESLSGGVSYGIDARHEYSTKKQYTIKFTSDVKIKMLYFADDNITFLDVSQCTSLETLSCGGNQLTSLDVSKNVNLRELSCFSNQLTSLDVSKNVNLRELDCNANPFTSLDVSKNVNLRELWCKNNPLTSLDVSKNVNLRKLFCNDNQLTSLDVSKNVNLEYLSCSSNQLTSLDVSKNVNLEYLWCDNNQLTSLDVSRNVNLLFLHCIDNQFTASAMNQIYNALHEQNTNRKEIYISAPYGDYSIAEEKGWTVEFR